MSRADRERWERKHRNRGSDDVEPSIAALPMAADDQLVLDLACGQGRNTKALLALGYRVIGVDISRTALSRLLARSEPGAKRLLGVQADLDDWPFGPERFDGIVQCAFLDRRLFIPMKAAVRPGGFILIDTFLNDGQPNARGPANAEFLLLPGELQALFADWEIVFCEETGGATKRARVLARKPAAARVHERPSDIELR